MQFVLPKMNLIDYKKEHTLVKESPCFKNQLAYFEDCDQKESGMQQHILVY